MLNQDQRFGRQGEIIAAEFLKKKGYSIIEANCRTPFGEIDIIAKHCETIVFVEVKSRHSDRFGLPVEAVGRRKQEKITRSALYYLKKHSLTDVSARFDVMGILFQGKTPAIELIENAFESAL
ncbi:MAG: YraN family protein [Deltaproteobacteria bacterium]|nr:YraN family protein [Deltaproteobacteria bacterium]